MSENLENPSLIDWSRLFEEFTDEDFEFIAECDDKNLSRLEGVAHKKSDNQRVILLCKHHLERNKNSKHAWVYLAAAYERMGFFKEAYKIYVEEVTRLEGGSERAQKVIRRLSFKLNTGLVWPGHYSELSEEYDARFDEIYTGVLIMYSRQSENLKDWNSLLFFNEQILKREATNMGALTRKALALKNLGRLKEALAIYENLYKLQKAASLSTVKTSSNIELLRHEISKPVDHVSESVKVSALELVES